MPRPRLTPEEREERRRARVRHSFSDAAYTHYDPSTEGYGSTDEWIAAVDLLTGGVLRASFNVKKVNPDLLSLYLDEMPISFDILKQAWRRALHKVHPDHGGTDAATIQVCDAFKRLSRHY